MKLINSKNEKIDIFGIVLFKNEILYLTDDSRLPIYKPYNLFIIDEWAINNFSYFLYEKSESIKIICGYKELIQSEDHYNGICNLEKKDLALFNIRKNQIQMNEMIPWYWKQRRLNEKKGISMKLICQSNTATSLDKTVREKLSFEETTFFNLSIGSIYIAYGMYAVNGALFYLLLGENSHFPILYPAELFSLKDQLLPIEWYFNYTKKNEAIWGYKPLALDPHHLALLLKQDPSAVSIFEKYKNQIDEWERMP